MFDYNCKKQMLKNTLKILSWNMQGLPQSNQKQEDEKFIKTIKMHDIACLMETHLSKDQNLNIEGFTCFKICRSKSKANNRCFVGIAVLYKN